MKLRAELLHHPLGPHLMRTRIAGSVRAPGVNVWHGCARRQAPPRGPSPQHPLLAPSPSSHPTLTANPASPQNLALRKGVQSLVARCTAIEDRFAALDARIDGLVAAHTATATKLCHSG
ncbi:hypothetical protein E2C01_047232 [Portunus trituberculatus]|uniref:Uncharacterized protein n=1 Tax=Portunus trituberculatus TaxID=210409 RepID=A0A5B7G7Z9_PORTR|nr:hypothetical protein [Portunus trituberculatus]